MPEQYLTIEHLTIKDLTYLFQRISIDPQIAWNGSPCWSWTGSSVKGGYGVAGLPRIGARLVHRILFAWAVHSIPKGAQHGEIDHLCQNVKCCNPAHLDFVDHRTNVLRGSGICAKNARKTHCSRGHLFDSENTYQTRKNGRGCLACRNTDRAARNLRKRKTSPRPKPPQLTHCKRGHALTPDNVRTEKHGRQCATCYRNRSREWARAHKPEPQPRQPKTACPQGHAIQGDNLYINSSGYRECLECKRERGRQYARRKRAISGD